MGVEKDFPIAILFRAFNDRPHKTYYSLYTSLFNKKK